MDLSKLPKLSQTKEEALVSNEPDPTPPAPKGDFCRACGSPLRTSARFCDACGAPTPRASTGRIEVGADAWMSIAMGVILLLMNPTMIKYVSSKLFGTEFAPFSLSDGTQVPYPKVYPQFFSDLCTTLFALVLIIESVAMVVVGKAWVLWVAFVTTVVVVLLNLTYIIMTMGQFGLPIISVIAVAFGVYIAIQQWAMLRALRP